MLKPILYHIKPLFKSLHISVIVFTCLMISCNSSKESDEDRKANAEIFKKEAIYLAEVAHENLSIIKACESLDTLNLQPELQQTLEIIKDEQRQVYDSVERLASDNIILIEQKAQENFTLLDSLPDNSEELKKALRYIQQKREKQLVILENLEDDKVNTNIKEVVKNLKHTILSNINKTDQTLEGLK